MHSYHAHARQLLVMVALGSALVTATAHAGIGGREKARLATKVFSWSYYLQANTTYKIETLNLSSGGDTVLHVQTYPDGNFLDGNDDCGTRLPGCTGYRSYVEIAAAPTDRIVWLVVRAYGSASGGSATLRITPGEGSPVDIPITFTAGYVSSFSSFGAGTHFLTVEEQGGTPDTVLLVTSGVPEHGMTFDDDDGMGNMSWVHTPEACPSGCRVIVGSLSDAQQGNTTLIWDEDIHTADCDGDGLGDSLENALGTQACTRDSDGDGLEDGVEVFGIDDPLLKFPYYGADPLVKDLFVEVSWLQCVPTIGNPNLCGAPANPDLFRLTGASAADVAGFFAPDVAVHADIGVGNTNPASWFTWGNWGGAARQASDYGDKCAWLSPSRRGYFHGAKLNNLGNGDLHSACFQTDNEARHFSHEMGHNENLGDWGHSSSGGVMAGCKPNYKSLMSYATLYDWNANARFSRGEFVAASLNPTAMDEMRGLGTTDPAKLMHLSDTNWSSDFRFKVDPATGAVDWNRDGRFSPGLVRAAPTWAWGGGGGCDQGRYQEDKGVSPGRVSTALSWKSWPNSSPRLYWFTRRNSDGGLEYRYATTFPDNCGSPPPENCRTNWYPAVGQAATQVPSALGAVSAPAATWWDNGAGTTKLVLVYRAGDNRLRYQTMSAWCLFGCLESWSAPAYVGTGAEVVTGDPAVVTWHGDVLVYAISGGRLKEWRLGSAGTWSGPVEQTLSGATLSPQFGIGVARGYVRLGTGAYEELVAAIPLASPAGQVEVAWRYGGSGYSNWTQLESTRWPQGKPVTNRTPGLAFVPFDRDASLTDGRYYLAWSPPLDVNGNQPAALLTQTEGNDYSTAAVDRRLTWLQTPAFYGNMWFGALANVSLFYDLSYDRNLRSSTTYWDANTSQFMLGFYPIFDGIFNGIINDQDDYAVIRSNLACV